MLYLSFHCLTNCSNFLLFSAFITQTPTDLVQKIYTKKSRFAFQVQCRAELPHYLNWFCLFGMYSERMTSVNCLAGGAELKLRGLAFRRHDSCLSEVSAAVMEVCAGKNGNVQRSNAVPNNTDAAITLKGTMHLCP